MLGRTASSLFWMSRQMERAENLARLIEVGYRISLTPGVGGHRNEWRSTLVAAASLHGYLARHGDEGEVDEKKVIDFLLFDPENPSSVRSCIEAARNNGRGVRTALTRDMWEALNSTWVEFVGLRSSDIRGGRLPVVLDRVRQRAMLFRGAMLGTTLRNDGYYFNQLGAFIERADQTARILDVKYYILLPRSEVIGGDVDTYQWETILRSVSANRAYRHVYREGFKPRNVVEFLILRAEMPRSLRFTYRWILESLTGLAHYYGSATPSLSEARGIHDMLEQGNLDRIFRDGLHEYLLDFIARNNALASSIAADYNFA
jgi:uncharacterized alpha-E superfamily protein